MEATGSAVAPLGALALAAMRGRPAEAARLTGSAIENVTRRGSAIRYAVIHWANAMLNNGLARFDDAMTAAVEATSYLLDRVRRHGLSSNSSRPRRGGQDRRRGCRTRATGRDDRCQWHRLGAGDQRAHAGADHRIRLRRFALSRGDRAARPYPDEGRPRQGTPALRRMVGTCPAPDRGAHATSPRADHVRRDGVAGVRRSSAARLAGHR